MSKTSTLTAPTANYDHVSTFDCQWRRCLPSHVQISADLGIPIAEINSWVENPEARYTLGFWIVVQYLNGLERMCREGIGCQTTFGNVLAFLGRNKDAFPALLKALSLGEREFFELLMNNENLNDEELAAFEVFAERVRSEDEPLQFVIALMTHLKPASEIANACNGYTSRVIELLQREDQEVLEPLRALLCRQ